MQKTRYFLKRFIYFESVLNNMYNYHMPIETEEDRERKRLIEKTQEDAICSKIKEFESKDNRELSDLLLTHFRAEKKETFHGAIDFGGLFVGMAAGMFSAPVGLYVTDGQASDTTLVAVASICFLPVIGVEIWNRAIGYGKFPSVNSGDGEIKKHALMRLYAERHNIECSRVKSHVYKTAAI